MIGLRENPAIQPDDDRGTAPPGYEDTDDIRLGDLMRGERATLGKSLLDVQRELRIRASFIAAIENCDLSAFDAPSFIPGYVRAYARYLGLDGDWVFRRFCAESGFQPLHGMMPAAPVAKPQRNAPDAGEALANPHALFLPQEQGFWTSIEPRAIGSFLVMIALVGGLGYGGWAVLQEVQKVNLTPGEQAPDIVATLDPVQEAAQPEPVDSASVNLPQPEGLDRIYRPQVLEVPILTARDGPIAAIDPGLAASASMTSLNVAGEVGADNPPEALATDGAARELVMAGPQLPADEAGVRTIAPDAPEVELLAVRPAWVRVTSADGTVLLEKTMDAGERFALPKLEEAPRLRAGNSGAVYFAVSGQTYGPAAPGAKVVRDIELSAESLAQSFAEADPSKDPELARLIALASAAALPAEDGGTEPHD